jgi:hypothetical protein
MISCLRNLAEFARRRYVILLLVAVPILALLATYRSEVQLGGYYVHSDPIRNLLVSQAIIDNGSIRLDEYDGNLIHPEGDYKYNCIGNHLYYHFPVGNSIVAVPFVLVANAAGRHMSRLDYEVWMQLVLASLSVAGLFIALFFLARVYAGQAVSLVIALSFAFGSPATSTLGSAWWSTNAQFFFITGALLAVAHRKTGWLTGSLLFFAYLCRPTSAVLIAPTMLVLLFVNRRIFTFSLIALVLWLIAFVLFSVKEYGSFLPPYYLPGSEWSGVQLVALKGLLFSPSRGLFIFFPQLLILPIALFYRKKKSRRNPLLVLCVFWPLLLILLISAYPNWWGGVAFGPRLLVETIPAWTLLTAAAWGSLLGRIRKTVAVFFIIFSFFGIWINLVQGLHNRETALWSQFPNSIDYNVERVFDWSQAQFLVSRDADSFIDYDEFKRSSESTLLTE